MSGWKTSDPKWVAERTKQWRAVLEDVRFIGRGDTPAQHAALRSYFTRKELPTVSLWGFSNTDIPLLYRVWFEPKLTEREALRMKSVANAADIAFSVERALFQVGWRPPPTLDERAGLLYKLFLMTGGKERFRGQDGGTYVRDFSGSFPRDSQILGSLGDWAEAEDYVPRNPFCRHYLERAFDSARYRTGLKATRIRKQQLLAIRRRADGDEVPERQETCAAFVARLEEGEGPPLVVSAWNRYVESGTGTRAGSKKKATKKKAPKKAAPKKKATKKKATKKKAGAKKKSAPKKTAKKKSPAKKKAAPRKKAKVR